MVSEFLKVSEFFNGTGPYLAYDGDDGAVLAYVPSMD